jgi:propionate CoA-transferase
MNPKDDLLRLPLQERLVYDARSNTFFINFEGLEIKWWEEIDAVRDTIEARLSPEGRVKGRTLGRQLRLSCLHCIGCRCRRF